MDPECAELKQWLHDYRQEREKAFEEKVRKGPVGRRPKRENTEAYMARLEMENDLLKKMLCRIARTRTRQAQCRLIYHQKERYEVKVMFKSRHPDWSPHGSYP